MERPCATRVFGQGSQDLEFPLGERQICAPPGRSMAGQVNFETSEPHDLVDRPVPSRT
jgi:hypothetical protein